ncbi:MAG: hypothetical protein KDA86_08690 [Planctomycetaceae bacterium]|nr:hypothetical protein [Planctomycetaceae bacterium]MCA9111692.1 hypothetical protein [Planctomycetaceae bacterium]
MALVEVAVKMNEGRLPQEVARFLHVASKRIDDFTENTRRQPIPAFVPSDFVAAYWILSAIQEQSQAVGTLFCEWGSGFGVVTCLAALLEYEAYGIEIERTLVAEAEKLAADFDIPAEFVEGSFVPADADDIAVTPGEVAWLATEGPDAYEALQIELDDFDIIYAYPWPGEDDILGDVFEAYASEGALLVTYNGLEDMRVRRKVLRRRRR